MFYIFAGDIFGTVSFFGFFFFFGYTKYKYICELRQQTVFKYLVLYVFFFFFGVDIQTVG